MNCKPKKSPMLSVRKDELAEECTSKPQVKIYQEAAKKSPKTSEDRAINVLKTQVGEFKHQERVKPPEKTGGACRRWITCLPEMEM
ncbi:hypothetical protein PoB_001671000 [Plakobranchus ocellatus]|uniref:Uncharacterized protein n=1 Tax=Plakobranchus ocellatus TaxID=259542 RepID=A0AAV3Z6M7_9GAST|nr:hypothetical protein PoB_001671000 [Plakobranchus ocellatus]